MKKIMLIILAAITIMGLWAGGTTDNSGTAAPAGSLSVSVSPSENTVQEAVGVAELYHEFRQDVAGVSRKYNNADITVQGVVIRTGPDIHGTPSIELSDTAGGTLYVLVVVNSFGQLNEVSIGETVTMKGNFHIFSSGNWGVVLKQGEILKKG